MQQHHADGLVDQVVEEAWRECCRAAQRWHRDWLPFLVVGTPVGRQEFHPEPEFPISRGLPSGRLVAFAAIDSTTPRSATFPAP